MFVWFIKVYKHNLLNVLEGVVFEYVYDKSFWQLSPKISFIEKLLKLIKVEIYLYIIWNMC